MNIFPSILLGIYTFSLRPVYSLDAEIEASIDKLIKDTFLPLNYIPGLSLSILTGDNADSMVRGYGFSNLENRSETTPSTLFGVGSISKSFVATMVVKMLTENFPELREKVLDTPIMQLIPSENFTLIDRFRSESVTFRDILSHRLCILPESLGYSLSPYKDKFEFFYRQRYAPDICSFRTEFQYSNAAYFMAGELIATIGGVTMEDLLLELFMDIGMHESTYFQESIDYDTKVNISRAYYRNETVTMKFNSELFKRGAVAAGGVLTTANDMLKYIEFFLNQGKVDGRQIVPEEAMAWMRKNANPTPFNAWKTPDPVPVPMSVSDYGYGLGWFLGIHDGYERIAHAGSRPPFVSLLSFYPAFKMGIYTAINGPGTLNRSTDLSVLHAEIFNILNGKNVSANAFTRTANTPKQTNAHLASFETQQSNNSESPLLKMSRHDIAGLYGNGLSGEFRITRLNDTGELYIRYGKWGTGFLRAKTNENTTFDLEWDTDLAQEDYVYGPTPLPFGVLEFSELNKAIFHLRWGGNVVFEKNLTLDKLPLQPWDPESCILTP